MKSRGEDFSSSLSIDHHTHADIAVALQHLFDRLDQMLGVSPARYPGVAHYLGLALIFCGVMALVISLWEYRWINRYLSGGSFAAIAGLTVEGKQTPTIAASILLTIIGIFAFFAVLLRFV